MRGYSEKRSLGTSSSKIGAVEATVTEELFDDGSISIVPVTDEAGEPELKLRVLERHEHWMNTKIDNFSTV